MNATASEVGRRRRPAVFLRLYALRRPSCAVSHPPVALTLIFQGSMHVKTGVESPGMRYSGPTARAPDGRGRARAFCPPCGLPRVFGSVPMSLLKSFLQFKQDKQAEQRWEDSSLFSAGFATPPSRASSFSRRPAPSSDDYVAWDEVSALGKAGSSAPVGGARCPPFRTVATIAAVGDARWHAPQQLSSWAAAAAPPHCRRRPLSVDPHPPCLPHRSTLCSAACRRSRPFCTWRSKR